MKRRSIILAVVLIAVVLTAALAACSNDPPGPSKPSDKFYTDGFTKSDVTVENAISDFVNGLYNTARPVGSNNPKTNANGTFVVSGAVNLNGIAFDLNLQINYAPTNIAENIVTLELTEKGKDEVKAGIYFYNNAETPMLYVHLGVNKMQFPLTGYTDIHPIAPLYLDSDASSLSAKLKELITLTSGTKVKYEYKQESGVTERHYYMDINLLQTMQNMLSSAALFGMNTGDWNFLCQNIFGVSSADVVAGKFPPVKLTLEFYTRYGTVEFGTGKLASIKMNADFEESALYSNTVFEGEEYAAVIDITSMLSYDSLKDIKKESTLTGFTAYSANAYRYECDFKYIDDSTNYKFIVEAEYNESNIALSKAAVYVRQASGAKNNVFALYYDNYTLYFNVSDTPENNASFHFDLEKFKDAVDAQILNQSDDNYVLRAVIYAMGSLRFTSNNLETLRYSYLYDNLTSLLGVTSANFLSILNDSSNDNVSAKFQNANIAFGKMMERKFVVSLDTDKAFIETITGVEMPNDKGVLNP